MADKPDGGPAFPESIDHEGRVWHCPGMTLRDYFAGQALVGLIQHTKEIGCLARQGGEKTDEYLAGSAYEIADAMIAEREKDGR